jgi:hypothetical protein
MLCRVVSPFILHFRIAPDRTNLNNFGVELKADLGIGDEVRVTVW